MKMTARSSARDNSGRIAIEAGDAQADKGLAQRRTPAPFADIAKYEMSKTSSVRQNQSHRCVRRVAASAIPSIPPRMSDHKRGHRHENQLIDNPQPRNGAPRVAGVAAVEVNGRSDARNWS